jgi:hypothetical protein
VTRRLLIAAACVLGLAQPARADRLFTSGFEWQAVPAAPGMEWSERFTSAPAIDTTTVRTGAASLRISSLVSGTAKGLIHQLVAASDAGPYYCRAYVRFATFPAAANAFMNLGPSSTRTVTATVTNTGVVQLRDDMTQVGSDSSALSLNTWYRIEMLGQRHAGTPNAGADTVTLLLDGVTVATSTTASLSNALSRFGVGGNLNGEANTTGDWYFDDVACNNSSGTAQTSFPGSGRVVHLVPNGAGEFAEAAATGAATPHEALDETTPDDVTSYVTFTADSASWSAATRLMVAVTDTSTAGIDSYDTITLVQVRARVANIDGSGNGTFVYGLQTQNTGTKAESAGIVVNSATWATDDDSAPSVSKLTAYVNPQGSAAWTTAAVDTIQIGARASDATPDLLMSTLVAQVEFVDGSPPASGAARNCPMLGVC